MPTTIDPNAYYTAADVKRVLDIGPRLLGNACTQGRLRFARIGEDRYFRGEWLIDWIEGRTPSPVDTTPPIRPELARNNP